MDARMAAPMDEMRTIFLSIIAQDRHEDDRRAHVRRRLELALYAVISMGISRK